MLPFIKKDLSLLLRDYKELALLLLMPLILIAILGFALGGLLQGDSVPLDLYAALVVHDDEPAGRSEFLTQLGDTDLPVAARLQLFAAAQALRPQQLLRSVLTDESLDGFLTLAELPAAEAAAQLARDDVQAVITVPAGFTRDLLERMLQGSGPGAEIQVDLSESSPLAASVVRDIVAGFARELNFRAALGQLGRQAPEPAPTGGIETVAGAEPASAPVSAMAYYTFGMAVMFVLFTVGSAASRAYLELTSNSFDRILVSGAGPLPYLLGKGAAAALVALLQLAFLLIVTTVLLGSLRGQPPAFWLQAASVSVLLAASVGALAALVTALTFRWRSKAVSDVFSSVFVTLLSLLGGSFFALADSSPLIGRLGQWTPNGAALNAFLGVTQRLPADVWGTDLLRLLLLGVLLLGAALLVFPRRKVA